MEVKDFLSNNNLSMRKNDRSVSKNACSVRKNDRSVDKNACSVRKNDRSVRKDNRSVDKNACSVRKDNRSVRKILFGIVSYRTPVKTYEMMLAPIFSASSRISSGSL